MDEIWGHGVGQLAGALRYKTSGRGFNSWRCHWNFSWHNPSGRVMALGFTQTLNKNVYQEYFLGVKSTGAYIWQPYHIHVPMVLKSGSLNLLENSGPLQAYKGLPYVDENWPQNEMRRSQINIQVFMGCGATRLWCYQNLRGACHILLQITEVQS